MARIAIMAHRNLTPFDAKTAIGIVRYRESEVLAVIDATRSGMTVAEALGMEIGHNIPVVRDIAEALRLGPDTLAIGISPSNDLLYPYWREQILAAIEAGLHIMNGLHFMMSEDAEISAAARMVGVRLWDVRKADGERRVARRLPRRQRNVTVLAVASDGSSGKMTTMLELNRAAEHAGLSSAFLATGQTGIMIAGDGVPADAIVSDFLAGAVEERVVSLAERFDWTFVEGQGALNHPAYSAVTLGIMHGALPDALVLCHVAGATTVRGWPDCRLPSLNELIRMNEDAANWLHPIGDSRVVGISLLTQGLSDDQAGSAIRRAEAETGLPATDVLRFGPDPLLRAVLTHGERLRRREDVSP